MRLRAYIKSVNWEALLLALFVFCACKPYFMWTINFVVPLTMKLISIIILFRHTDIKNNKNAIIFAIWSGGLLFSSIVNFSLSLGKLIDILYVVPALFIKKDFLEKIYGCLIRVFAVFLSLSLISWFGSMLGYVSSTAVIPPLNPLMEYDYQVYPFCVVPMSFVEAYIFRFHGLFDEPGVVGTYCMLFLFIEEFNLRKWYNIPLLISGICSFSIAFIIGAVACLFFILITKKAKYSLLVLILSVGFVIVTKDIPIFQDLIYARLEWNEDTGSIAGDNRSGDEQDAYLRSIRWSSEYFFGVNDQTKLKNFEGSWGYKNIILRDGLVFLFFYIAIFAFLAKSRKLGTIDFLKFITLLLMVLYQRPDLYDLAKILLFTYAIGKYSENRLFNKRQIAQKIIA